MRLASLSIESRRGQMLSFDFLIAAAIFLFVIAILLIQAGYSMKDTKEFGEKNILMKDAEAISNIFFEEGLPDDWTNDTVMAPGMETSNRIDRGKIAQFSQIPYQRTISMLGLRYNYNVTIFSGSSVLYSFGASYANSTSLVKIERIGVLDNGTMVRIESLVFEK